MITNEERTALIIVKKPFPLANAYQLLEPGPVVMVSTSLGGKPNIMTMSWHTMIDFEPPIVSCVISDENYTFNRLKETKECVINIPTEELAKQVVGVGNTTGAKVDKFNKFNLTAGACLRVNAPMIVECYANLECKVIDMRMATKYNLFILEILFAWITPSKKRPRTIHHCGNGVFVVDGKVIKLVSKKK